MNPKNETAFRELVSCLKRCKSMGAYVVATKDVFDHPLAAPICNYMDMVETEWKELNPDYRFILECHDRMAKCINKFCEKNVIKDDRMAQHWLESFLWYYSKYQVLKLV